MNRDDVHRCWAPAQERWSVWVKPVLFAALGEEKLQPTPLPPTPDWLRRRVIEPLVAAPDVADAAHPYRGDPLLRDTALVIDLPGAFGARVGIGFVDHGFRPIPLYNAVPSPVAVVDLGPTMAALVDGAERVATVPLGAPPAFLLDADRMGTGRPVRAGAFDNRSICRASDFPSAETLLQAGIRRAVLIQAASARPASDLEPVLLTWQRRGIALWLERTDATSAAAPFALRRRAWPIRLAHLVRRSMLHRRSDDSYGTWVPEPGAG